ncbi:putative nucleic acid-binding protein, contains PIN domain [Thioflavicoccus mobilis 8321]|uniref:Putative nucleic acid-binding protein, contains PIN domain n=1 Tax=Thioflavicoccus mobilis 8321 TaxID=765912 RepID=L0GZP0_9GAMM|nr:type II toxin-antitoxin system VapC family toxin [Thioflavicoccus mobilis]AGA91436.1 putative nucleic acid-binding protein, contains PIN domain [Thioflavicoccus mobilis 8321]
MGPVKALFDTNILIDYLNGVVAARDEIGRYQRPLISLINWMEVLTGTPAEHAQPVRAFLRRFECVGIDAEIAERAVNLRQAQRLKLPDAIIRATAMERSALLVTRNTKDFLADEPGIRIPYKL